MANGSTKAVEEIRVGDRVMGQHGPTDVKVLHRGTQKMVEIVPVKGEPWRVNLDHVLSVHIRHDHREGGQVFNLLARDYIGLADDVKRRSTMFKAPVARFDDEPAELPIPPYILGVLLGDGYLPETPGRGGVKGSIMLTSIDPEIIEAVRGYAESIGMRIRTGKGNDARHHRIVGRQGYGNNALRPILRTLGLLGSKSGTKFIPAIYKIASMADRLEILAGLIDTDGSLSGCRTGFEFVSKSRQLAEDVAFVARSLGLAVPMIKPTCKRSQTGTEGTYFRLHIGGHGSMVPTRVARKQAAPRQTRKDPLRVGFKLGPIEEPGEFFGFEVGGNHRYLLGDFTVTHNSGKGAAYLVPGILAVLRDREIWKEQAKEARAQGVEPPPPPQLIISTANIALQQQLVKKDIPAISAALGAEIRACLLKGRNNYLCRDKLDEQEQVQWSNQGDDAADLRRLMEWAGQTATGDREDLPFQAAHQAWGRLTVMAKDCAGKDCRFAPAGAERRCFAEVARAGWKTAHIIVCNHHLLSILPRPFPNVSLLALDEAHELEEAIRSTQSMEVRRTHAKHHGSRLAKYTARNAELIEVRIGKLADCIDDYWARKAGPNDSEVELQGGWCPLDRDYFAPILAEAGKLADLVEGMRVNGQREEAGRLVGYVRQLIAFHGRCVSMVEVEPYEGMPLVDIDAPWAFWLEKNQRGSIVALAAPADVAGGIWRLQACYPKAILTSATLATAGSFEPLRLCYGLGRPGQEGEVEDEVQVMGDGPREELVLPSPFPLADMGVLVVPDGPSPKEQGWREWAAEQAVEAIAQAEGRTLVLCTSNASMRLIAERARERLPQIPVRRQGEAGRTELRDWFVEEEEHTLIASRSFFQGIDVPGSALSCVVIDRLPFAVPDHPLEKAVCQLLIDRAGKGTDFTVRSLPGCCTALAQATGRLIRSQSDRGALVCLDVRLTWKNSTGRTLRNSVPPFPISREIADVGRLLRGEQLGRTIRKPVRVTGRSLRPRSRRAKR